MANCIKCGYPNPETARFCQSCGSPLVVVVQPTTSELPPTLPPRKGLTYGQKWALGGGIFVIVVIIIAVGASMSSSPYRAAFSPSNMKIQVSSAICWTGAVGGSASFSVEGCGTKSWNFPNEKVVAGTFQLDNKNCDFDYSYNLVCEPGSLRAVAYHTNGSVCKEASTSAQFGVVSVACSEL